jgi:hypothetical protein
MKFEINIQKIVVLENARGHDTITITTDMQATMWPWDSPCDLRIETASKTGADYVRKVFDVEPDEIISMGSKLGSFSKVRE